MGWVIVAAVVQQMQGHWSGSSCKFPSSIVCQALIDALYVASEEKKEKEILPVGREGTE
jgi:hypothetical protein